MHSCHSCPPQKLWQSHSATTGDASGPVYVHHTRSGNHLNLPVAGWKKLSKVAAATAISAGCPSGACLACACAGVLPVLAAAMSQSSTGLAFCARHGQPNATDVRSGIFSRPAQIPHHQGDTLSSRCCELDRVLCQVQRQWDYWQGASGLLRTARIPSVMAGNAWPITWTMRPLHGKSYLSVRQAGSAACCTGPACGP